MARPRPYDTSLDDRRGRARRRLSAWLGGLALLLNLLAGVAMPARAMLPAAFPAADDMAICTVDGIRHVTPAPESQPEQHDHGALPPCLFCLPLLQGHAAPAGVVALAAPGPARAMPRAPPATTGIVHPRPAGAWTARGPPGA